MRVLAPAASLNMKVYESALLSLAITHMTRVGQNRINTPYMTVYLVTSLPKIPYIHSIYMVLADPTLTRVLLYSCTSFLGDAHNECRDECTNECTDECTNECTDASAGVNKHIASQESSL